MPEKQITIHCETENGIEEALEHFADAQSKCKILTAETARAMIDSGAATSISDASRKMAAETGENPETVRKRIQRGGFRSGNAVPKKKPAVDILDILVSERILEEGQNLRDCQTVEYWMVEFIYVWTKLKKAGESELFDRILESVRDRYKDVCRVTNNWHNETIACHCPKCNGRRTDIRHLNGLNR